jgi:hypothetical protein
MLKSVAELRAKKKNVLAKNIFVSKNLFVGFGRFSEESLEEQVICFYMINLRCNMSVTDDLRDP